MISVIVPVYNEEKTIGLCISSILDSYITKDMKVQVAVIDDGSTDKTQEILVKFRHIKNSNFFIKMIRFGHNRGVSAARNEGIKQSEGDVIFFIDADVIVNKDTLYEVNNAFKDKNVDCIVGMYSKKPLNNGFFNQYMALFKYYNWSKLPQGKNATFRTECGALRRDIINDIGFFNEDYKSPSVEDYDIGYRINKYNSITINKNVVVMHIFHGFAETFKNYINRTSSWLNIYSTRRKFDNVTTTYYNALISLISGIIILMIPYSILSNSKMSLGIFIISYIALNMPFYLFITKNKNIIFLAYSAFVNYLMNIAVFIGFMKFSFKRVLKT